MSSSGYNTENPKLWREPSSPGNQGLEWVWPESPGGNKNADNTPGHLGYEGVRDGNGPPSVAVRKSGPGDGELLLCQTINPAEPMPTNTNQDPLDLDEKVFLKNKCTIPGFEFIVVKGWTHWTMLMGYQLNVLTQAPYMEDQTNILNSIYIMRTYSELRDGNHSITIILRNLTGKLVITWVLAVNKVSLGKPTPELIKKLEKTDPE